MSFGGVAIERNDVNLQTLAGKSTSETPRHPDMRLSFALV